ncbi:hypothetical protein ACFQ48_10330 [Hymenobacter caeli]|uniref:Tetratricopeptide repeat protein n=1 Tax=Hymenobacter caeli TaxID=2735894 RepID=A0ABX2FTT4_9BACT|nr:hypothetical protein [Hymenobacter caeli]NRT19759.1 hypothetical protein [Hymenobacter caeli]
MTRAALLHVLDHATAIAPAEVRELEQLAQAFPYCQTAHLLLAKAAHDQGTMLAGQRLRRAATYAADRELLRRLIEQVGPAAVLVANANESVVADRPSGLPPVEPSLSEAAGATAAAAPAAGEVTEEAPAAEITAEPVTTAETTVPAPAAASNPTAVTPTVDAPVAEAMAAEAPTALPATNQATELAEPLPTEAQPTELDVAPAVAAAALATPQPAPADALPQGPNEPELPAAAPPVRPPEDAGVARLEFGLNEALTAPVGPVYELPGLVDEWAAAAATLALAAPEPAARPEEAGQPAWSPAAFTGDVDLGYGLSGGSRLGFAMQLRNSWEADDQAADAAFPAAAVPPRGEFFAPDALLLAHWEAHRPPDLPTAVDLVNNFLRRQPRLTRPAMLSSVGAGAQADLSARSTRPEAELASEGLAQILVRQGKTARAVEIYERLMVKQPEKMAYFAAQIQQLQPPAH